MFLRELGFAFSGARESHCTGGFSYADSHKVASGSRSLPVCKVALLGSTTSTKWSLSEILYTNLILRTLDCLSFKSLMKCTLKSSFEF